MYEYWVNGTSDLIQSGYYDEQWDAIEYLADRGYDIISEDATTIHLKKAVGDVEYAWIERKKVSQSWN